MTAGERAFSFGRESLAAPRRRSRNLLGAAAPSAGASLRDEGAIIQVTIQQPVSVAARLKGEGRQVPDPFRALAMVDTGASITAIERTVAERLGLLQTGVAPVAGVTGVAEQPVYAASLGFLSPSFTLDPWSMIGSPIGRQGFHVLLGRDVLQRLRLIYDGASGAFSLSPADGGLVSGPGIARVAGVVLAFAGVGTAAAFATGLLKP